MEDRGARCAALRVGRSGADCHAGFAAGRAGGCARLGANRLAPRRCATDRSPYPGASRPNRPRGSLIRALRAGGASRGRGSRMGGRRGRDGRRWTRGGGPALRPAVRRGRCVADRGRVRRRGRRGRARGGGSRGGCAWGWPIPCRLGRFGRPHRAGWRLLRPGRAACGCESPALGRPGEPPSPAALPRRPDRAPGRAGSGPPARPDRVRPCRGGACARIQAPGRGGGSRRALRDVGERRRERHGRKPCGGARWPRLANPHRARRSGANCSQPAAGHRRAGGRRRAAEPARAPWLDPADGRGAGRGPRGRARPAGRPGGQRPAAGGG